MKEMIWDTHVHLDFIRKPRDVAREAETLGMGLFAMTVTPRDFQAFQPELESAANVRVGAGLHPRWIADGRCGAEDLSLMVELALENRYVGEIGLDASPKHVPERTLGVQTAAFEKICAACAEPAIGTLPRSYPSIP